MSVVVRLPKSGTVVLAIDAIYIIENLQNDNWQGQVDPVRGKESGHKLAEIARRENGMLITGHDPWSWAELKLAPKYYE
jgi:N-acyl homoserine lactone hydrolase